MVPNVPPAPGLPLVVGGALQVVVVVALVDHVPPGGSRRGRVHPRLQRHRARQCSEAESGTVTRELVPLKLKRRHTCPPHPGRVRHRAVIAAPRRIRTPSTPTPHQTQTPRPASARWGPGLWRWRCWSRGRGWGRRRWRGRGSCSWCRQRRWCRCSWWWCRRWSRSGRSCVQPAPWQRSTW